MINDFGDGVRLTAYPTCPGCGGRCHGCAGCGWVFTCSKCEPCHEEDRQGYLPAQSLNGWC